jgi:ABC-type transport system involved in multi-copper enzyme maturation permease subunit
MAAVFWFTIRQHLRLRRLWFTLLLLAGPAALVLLIRHFAHNMQYEHVWRRYQVPMVFMLFMIVLPLVSMLHGSALIGAEADSRTLVYLITRRLRRETVLIVRFAAVWILLTVLAVLAAVALHFCSIAGLDVARLNETASLTGDAAWRPAHDLLGYLGAIPFAVAAFLAVFTLFSLVFPRPLVVSLLYLIIGEMIVGNAPVQAQVYTISHQLRRMLNSSIPFLMDVLTPAPNRSLVEPLYVPGRTGVIPLLAVTLLALALAAVAVRTRELQPAKTSRE